MPAETSPNTALIPPETEVHLFPFRNDNAPLSRMPAAAEAAKPQGGTRGARGGLSPPHAFPAFSASSAFSAFPGVGAAPRGLLPVPSSFPGAEPRPALSGSLPLSRGLPPPPFRFRYENARPRNGLRSGVGFSGVLVRRVWFSGVRGRAIRLRSTRSGRGRRRLRRRTAVRAGRRR